MSKYHYDLETICGAKVSTKLGALCLVVDAVLAVAERLERLIELAESDLSEAEAKMRLEGRCDS